MTAPWTKTVAARVNARLQAFFDDKRRQARELSPRAPELVDAIAELTMRGGKRLRPIALHAGFRAVCDDDDLERTSTAGAALELLQSYFLIHDDFMDDDDERRGGPAVHVLLRERCGDARLGENLAILAGDLAAGFAFELLHGVAFPASRRAHALSAFTTMHLEVVCGQQLDLLGDADVSRIHDLKTGSYTVRGPLRLGALLGDGRPEQLSALQRFGEPLGVAFQLRDDLLGTFGDPRVTGKPAGQDLRLGKHTALVAEARASLPPEQWAALERVLGRSDASAGDLARAGQLLIDGGVRARVETKLDELLQASRAVLDQAPLAPAGREMLRELLDRLAVRDA